VRRIRRSTGYLSTIDRFNAAKKNELLDRRPHLTHPLRAGADR
jgi:anaerobic ribonucleoside-triphosphate reductase